MSVSTNQSEIYKTSWADFELHALAALALTLAILMAMERILRTETKATAQGRPAPAHAREHEPGNHAGHQGPADSHHQQQVRRAPGTSSGVHRAPAAFRPAHRVPGEARQRHAPIRRPPMPERRHEPGAAMPRASSRSANGRCRTEPSSRCAAVIFPTAASCRPSPTSPSDARRRAHVARLASEDPLTGLPNRRVFRSTLDQMCGRSGSTASGAGSGICRSVPRSRSLQGRQRHAGPSYRGPAAAGGRNAAEAGVAAERCPGAARRRRIRHRGDRRPDRAPRSKHWPSRLIEAVSQPYEIDGHRIRSSISIGIAVGPRDGSNAEDLLDGGRSGALRGQGERARDLSGSTSDP